MDVSPTIAPLSKPIRDKHSFVSAAGREKSLVELCAAVDRQRERRRSMRFAHDEVNQFRAARKRILFSLTQSQSVRNHHMRCWHAARTNHVAHCCSVGTALPSR
jgi:hypothetical protein